MNWIIEPIAGFGAFEASEESGNCTGGGTLNECSCTGGLLSCNCTGCLVVKPS